MISRKMTIQVWQYIICISIYILNYINIYIYTVINYTPILIFWCLRFLIFEPEPWFQRPCSPKQALLQDPGCCRAMDNAIVAHRSTKERFCGKSCKLRTTHPWKPQKARAPNPVAKVIVVVCQHHSFTSIGVLSPCSFQTCVYIFYIIWFIY